MCVCVCLGMGGGSVKRVCGVGAVVYFLARPICALGQPFTPETSSLQEKVFAIQPLSVSTGEVSLNV